ncbi:hypothetical protein EXIGLDRAFT_719997 [Exidia glandulosa HHB12029]|uniref:Enhancer of polycomb-like protein n=1 Tax=Exidia glandulosa HHB12029 TaxID=1314781 RepID=A0A165NLT3_EXIGL|nr:hypothetical protein EXIGLDRAFT_719997 [Exidia glandulosa HHB12029]
MVSHREKAAAPRSRPNRITHKTRLRVLVGGEYDVEPLLLDDDDEKTRGLSTAGVDAEDANEHHLQAVLSAAAVRQQAIHATRHTTRSRHGQQQAEPEPEAGPSASIPIPDATGIAHGAEKLYPSGVWKDPDWSRGGIKFSDTVEESIRDGLTGENASYYMDERDKSWLDRHNALVENAGPQSSASSSATVVVTPRRSALKGKGKEREIDPCPAPLPVISEDEFELVMGLFERHCTRVHPHLDLDFKESHLPHFHEFERVVEKLNAHDFASHVAPTWLPPHAKLVRIARSIYPHWCERRIQRQGLPIFPPLLMDETQENENDSFLCFRRREVKQARKTRKQDQHTIDRMLRLQGDLSQCLTLAKDVVTRALDTRSQYADIRRVWDARLAIVDLKRKFPALEIPAEDEPLLYERERKRPRISAPELPATIAPEKVSTTRSHKRQPQPRSSETPALEREEPSPRLPDIVNTVNHYAEKRDAVAREVEALVLKRKAEDAGMEDVLDVALPPPVVPKPLAHFRPMAGRGGAMRTRVGRGGRMLLDRHPPRMRQSAAEDSKLTERWKFDEDTPLPVDVEDEQRHIVVDDYHPDLIRHRAALPQEQDIFAFTLEPWVQSRPKQEAAPPSIIASDNQIRLSFRREQPAPRPSPPVVVAPPTLQNPAIRPSPSPTTTVPPPLVPSSSASPHVEVARTPTPAPVTTPIRPPSVAAVLPTMAAPVPIARAPTPAPPQQQVLPSGQLGQPVLRTGVNPMQLRGTPMGTPKPYTPSLPVMNGHHPQNVNGMVMANGAPAGMLAAPNGVMAPHLFPPQRPMSRAATAPNGFPNGAMQMGGGMMTPTGDASGSGLSRVPSPVRPKTAMNGHMGNGMQFTAANMMQMPNGAIVPSQQGMQNGTYAMQMQMQPNPNGMQQMNNAAMFAAGFSTQMVPGLQQYGLDAQQMQQLKSAFAHKTMHQQQQQQQQQHAHAAAAAAAAQQHHQQNTQQQQHQQQQPQQQQQRFVFAPGMNGNMNMMGGGSMNMTVPMNRTAAQQQNAHYNAFIYQQQQQQLAAMNGSPVMTGMPIVPGMNGMMMNGGGGDMQMQQMAPVMMVPQGQQQQRVVVGPNGQLVYAPPPPQSQVPGGSPSKSQGANGAPPVSAH